MLESSSMNEAIISLLGSDSENRTPAGDKIYDQPLVGFVDAADPLFEKMKDDAIIGSVFRLPGEWLPGAVTIISYFLPFTMAIKKANYKINEPSEDWMHARFLGEKVNDKIRNLIVRMLTESGGRAIAPVCEPDFAYDHDRGLSNWSERHVAFAAGLGTFGLSRGLITEKGMAGRFGSVITDLNFPPSIRSSEVYYKDCPFLIDKSCGACIDRCPAGAISEEGMDKAACKGQIEKLDQFSGAIRNKYSYPYSACGKCQVDVPCENSIPD